MIDIKGIGSEGVVLLTLWILVKDVIVPLVRQRKFKRSNPSVTQHLDPNAVTAKEVLVALKAHEEHDTERTGKIEKSLTKLTEKVSEHGETLAVLKNRSQ